MAEYGQGQGQQGSTPWFQSTAPADFAGPYQAYQPQQSMHGYNTSSFDDEPPLLEELGIDIPRILHRAKAVIFGRFADDSLKELDLGGPLLLALALGTIHLLMGKLHFGVILGWTICASIAISWVASMIAGPNVRSLDLYSCSCLLGYCLLPMLAFSATALFIRRGLVLAGLGVGAAAWAARSAAALFAVLSTDMREHFWLLFYPCMLYYGSFALISVY